MAKTRPEHDWRRFSMMKNFHFSERMYLVFRA